LNVNSAAFRQLFLRFCKIGQRCPRYKKGLTASGTDIWAYRQAVAAALAGSDPARAVDNADSHEYFGENDPRRKVRRR